MTIFGNTLIYLLRILSVVMIFFIASSFTFQGVQLAQSEYTQAVKELANKDTKEGFTLKKFSFVSVANAVDIKEEFKKEQKEEEVKNIPKPIAQKKVIKKVDGKNGIYKITGYNAVPEQTDDSPTIAAWNDNIEHAVNVAAVVQDSPWKRGTCLTISGLPEQYIVLDRFNKRYNGQKKVDILVGTKAEAKAITGKRTVTVSPPGSCDLKRVIDGKIVYEKLQKKRFK